ncbi:CD1247 N-terminal domain-containing protein [Peptococcus simiae]|uniref:CD1247 N-terminal domain-containing protein n=1 Tax=Peptococcus simiae TaxID=1643805 RepID=UPI00397FAD5B
MAISERVAYLKGLADGLGLQEKDKTGKFYTELISLIEEMALVVDYLQDETDEMEEYLDALDEDLSDVEEAVFDFDDEYDDDDFEDYDFNTLGNYMESECPGCGETIAYFDDTEDDQAVDIVCPNCGEVVTTIGEDNEEDVIDIDQDEEGNN